MIKNSFPFIIITDNPFWSVAVYLMIGFAWTMYRSYTLSKRNGTNGAIMIGSTWRGLLWAPVLAFYLLCIPALIAGVFGQISYSEGAGDEFQQ